MFPTFRKVVQDTALFSGLFCAGEYTATRFVAKQPVDEKRMKRNVAWAVPTGVFVSYWYHYLDGSVFKKTRLMQYANRFGSISPLMKLTSGALITKALVDVAMDLPVYSSYIVAQHHDQPEYPMGSNIAKMYATDLAFWIPVNLINFFKVQPKFRVPFYSVAIFTWSVLLPCVTSKH